MNYSQLQTDIAAMFAREDLPATAFISLAEQELNQTLRVQGMEDMLQLSPTGQTDDGLWYIDYPTDFLELKHIESGGVRLDYLSNNQMNTEVGNFYSLADEKILLSDDKTVDIYYYKRIPALSDQNETNWFTDNAYNALFYMSCGHATYYMGEDNNYMETGLRYRGQVQLYDDNARMSGAPLVQHG